MILKVAEMILFSAEVEVDNGCRKATKSYLKAIQMLSRLVSGLGDRCLGKSGGDA
jgi:hypothetical protein